MKVKICFIKDQKLENSLNFLLDTQIAAYKKENQVFLLEFEESKPNGENIFLSQCLGIIEDKKNDQTPKMYIGEHFSNTFKVYNDDFLLISEVSHKPVLNSLVLISKDEKSSDFSKDSSFINSLVSSQSLITTNTSVFVKTESIQFQYFVINTTPFKVGTINQDTKVYVFHEYLAYPSQKVTPKFPKQNLADLLLVSPFIKKNGFMDEKKINLKIETYNSNFYFSLLENINIDMNKIGFVSYKTLRELKIFNGTWSNITWKNESKCLYIVSLSKSHQQDFEYDFQENIIYVPKIFEYNLMGHESNFKKLDKTVELAPIKDQKPNLATEIIITPIHSPNYYIDEKLEQNQQFFEEYFKNGRVLSQGDIIALKYPHEKKFVQFRDPSHTLFYYKIEKLTGEKNNINGFYADLSSSLITQGETRSYLPDLESDIIPSLENITPYLKLKESILSLMNFQKKMMNLTFSFLLYGDPYLIPLCVHSIARRMGMHLIEINSYELVTDDDSKIDEVFADIFKMAKNCTPTILHFKNFEGVAINDQGLAHLVKGKVRHVNTILSLLKQYKNDNIYFICSTDKLESISIPFRSLFNEKINFEGLNQKEREQILGDLLKDIPVSKDITAKYLSKQVAGSSVKEIINLIKNSTKFASKRIEKYVEKHQIDLQDISCFQPLVLLEDFEKGIEKLKKSTADKIGTPQIPNVRWQDIGGLENAKKELLECIQLPLEQSSMLNNSLKQRSGVLLYGPPGTGKTLLAKAVATECSLNFLSVKGPELINMYIGESEKNVRDVFKKAREAKPCVIFFDELDSLAPNRGVSGDSGGVMDRVVSQLLAELDSVQENQQKQQQVFVIAATNRPDLLDPALLRPGRFDRLVYLGISDDKEHKLKILQAQTRKFKLGKSVNLEDIASQCLSRFTGADYFALCTDALMSAIMRQAEEHEIELEKLNQNSNEKIIMNNYLSNKNFDIYVEKEDFEKALANLTPSVSEKDLLYYEELQNKFKK